MDKSERKTLSVSELARSGALAPSGVRYHGAAAGTSYPTAGRELFPGAVKIYSADGGRNEALRGTDEILGELARRASRRV